MQTSVVLPKEVMNIELIEQETTEIVEYSKTEAWLTCGPVWPTSNMT